MDDLPSKPTNSVENNPAILQYFIGKFNNKFNKIYRGFYTKKEVNIMSNKCPHCGADVSLSDPYRTAPPKMPDPILAPPKKIRWYEKMNWRNFFYNLWEYTVNVFWSLVVISIIGFGIFCLYKWQASPDKVDYCYVDASRASENSWTLIGHIDWGEDRHFGKFSGVLEAQQYAKKINCPLDITPIDNPSNITTPPVSSSAEPIQPSGSASGPPPLWAIAPLP